MAGRWAKDFGHLTYGYVITSHASQGKNVHGVLVAGDRASRTRHRRGSSSTCPSREAASRAVIYTHNKQALLRGRQRKATSG